MIKQAFELLPDDPAIQKEHAAIQKLAGQVLDFPISATGGRSEPTPPGEG
jgi:hypothetical protein